ncbi:MAG: ImmA/IrrE family metallo-endopeptidase [Solirubrobacterales bacterium]
MRPDDRINDEQLLARIRAEARRALEEAGAIGVLPTPIDDVIAAAKHTVHFGADIDEGFLKRLSRNAAGKLKSALSKVWGVLDVAGRTMHLDRLVHPAKTGFLKVHELAHGLLTWQRDLYAITADCEQTISPDVAEEFDREANAFASEVLFQLDRFTEEAADHSFGLRTPLKLSKKYGASLYSTIRRYVSTNDRVCAVIVLEPPLLQAGPGFAAEVRRVEYSASFLEVIGTLELPQSVTPDDDFGAMVPMGATQKMSRPREIVLEDRNGERQLCIGEAFKNSYYVFILIHRQAALTKRQIVVSA